VSEFKRQWLGAPIPLVASASTSNTFQIASSTSQMEWIFRAATTDPITWVAFRTSAISGTATTWKLSIQGVTTTDSATTGGVPDGTIKGGGSPASVTFTNSSLTAGAITRLTLANSYTPSYRGEPLAAVLAYDSGTTPSAGVQSVTVNTHCNVLWANEYVVTNSSGSRSKISALPIVAYGTASQTYGVPISALTTQGVNNSSTNELAMRFSLSGTGTYTVPAMRVRASAGGVGRLFRARLYSGTTVLQDSTDIDCDIVGDNSSGNTWTCFFDESSLSVLSMGTEYRIAIAPQNSSTVSVSYLDVPQDADMAAFPGGTDMYASTRAGGSWSDTTTRRFLMEFAVDDLTGSGGVSGSRIFTGF